MFVVNSLPLAILLCVITMLGWGSWANTQKLAGRDKWPFALYYWDYALGTLLLALVLAFTLGSFGPAGQGAFTNLARAEADPTARAVLSGVLFNISNILLVVAIDAAGMSVAFPLGVGLALLLGTVGSYVEVPKGNPLLLFGGVGLIMLAMLACALAYSKLPRTRGAGWKRGVVFAATAGCLMGFFYPQLIRSISADFRSSPIEPGYLTPYSALLLFSVGLVASNFVVNTLFMKVGQLSYSDYFRGTARLHWLGVLGGIIWMTALTCNVVASGVAGPAVSYALGQGATLVAAIWGVAIWREFRGAPPSARPLIVLMFIGYAAGLALIGTAIL